MANEAATAKDSDFLLISMVPDVCFTPKKPPHGVPVPYPIMHKMDKSKQCSPNVFFRGKPAYLHEESYVDKVTGDEPGMGKGVVSGTNTNISRSQQHSKSVFVNGRALVRTGDMVWMNRAGPGGGGGGGKGFVGKLRGELHELPGVETENFIYEKRSYEDLKTLRNEFDRSGRSDFLKSLSSTPKGMADLGKAGFSKMEIAKIRNGKLPNRDWQVHHIKPLDDGGTNSFSNLTLIKNEPYHKVITNTQRSLTGGMKAGDKKMVAWPTIKTRIYPANRSQ